MEDLTVPGDLRSRLQSIVGHRRDLLVVAGVIFALLLVAGAAWQRRTVVEIAPPATSRDEPDAASSHPASSLFVHVAGAVRSPGLYELRDGARVADAVAAAGGPRKNGDLDMLNLAQLLTDGMKVDVPREGDDAPPAPLDAADAAASSVISINNADQAQLETIPGIGPVTARAVLAHRSEIGGFSALEQLLDVNGIGPATYEAMIPYVSL